MTIFSTINITNQIPYLGLPFHNKPMNLKNIDKIYRFIIYNII